MYCRKCGNKISDTDIYCQFCGTPTEQTEPPASHAEAAEGKEEIIFNPPYENHRLHHTERELRFAGEESFVQDKDEDLTEFISENEIKEAHRGQKNETGKPSEEKRDGAGKPLPARSSEFTWNVHDFPTPGRKTEDIKFNWNMEKFGQQEHKEEAAASFEEELFREISEDSKRIKEENIDRFFTFSRKNEEFQELLDREYEKLNMKFEPEADHSAEETASTPAAETELPAAETESPEAETESPEAETESPEAETELPEAETESPEAETEAAEEEVQQEEAPQDIDALSEMAQLRALFFGTDLIKDNESIRQKLDSVIQGDDSEPEEQIEVSEPEKNIVPEPAEQNLIPESAEQNLIPEPVDQEAEPLSAEPDQELAEQDAVADLTEPEQEETTAADQQEETTADDQQEEVLEQEAAPDLQAEVSHRPEEEAAEQPADTADMPERAAEQPEDPVDKPKQATDRQKEAVLLSEETSALISQLFAPLEDEEKEAHKKSAGQIVLIIIAVILAIEIAILGISYFAPNSTAAEIINNTQHQIFQTVSGWADGIKDLFSGKDANDEEASTGDNNQNPVVDNTQSGQPAEDQNNTGTKPVVPDPKPASPDPNPAADKNALVASQLGNNKNIEQVKANEALAYQKGKDYGQADINNSKPIANNIWQTPENGDAVYYDKSIVGAIISFDSQWIDYVNGGGKGVLDLLKKDSEAYRKTASFSKIGKIKEAFKLLEIGEIRQGGKGFYVWTHEEMQVTEKGKTSVTKYNWIYYLEPVEGKMKIVNYFKFQ